LIEKTKAEPNHANISRVIRLVKQTFLSKDDEKDEKTPKEQGKPGTKPAARGAAGKPSLTSIE